MFESDEAAKTELDRTQSEFEVLSGSVQLCVRSTVGYLQAQRSPDVEQLMWARITEADVAFLLSKRPKAVAQRYRAALTEATGFAITSAREDLELFERLGVRAEFVAEALQVVRELDKHEPETPAKHSTVVLFTGHRVDEPGRNTPRFPNTDAAEAEARRLIREAVEKEKSEAAGGIIGIAGGGSGADILFHEVCEELGIATRLYLALPPDQFSAASVAPAGPKWVARYNRLTQRLKPTVLAEKKDLPHWLATTRDYDLWQRNNLWMMFNALAGNATQMTLVALWNGKRAMAREEPRISYGRYSRGGTSACMLMRMDWRCSSRHALAFARTDPLSLPTRDVSNRNGVLRSWIARQQEPGSVDRFSDRRKLIWTRRSRTGRHRVSSLGVHC